MRTKPIYNGYAHIYLEGLGALQPINIEQASQHIYYIGSSLSSILIKDYRQEPIQAAKAQLNGDINFEFAEIFNQPAKIRIWKIKNRIEIVLYKCQALTQNVPILWMGVLQKNEMPVRKIYWETINRISDTEIAFAALTS